MNKINFNYILNNQYKSSNYKIFIGNILFLKIHIF